MKGCKAFLFVTSVLCVFTTILGGLEELKVITDRIVQETINQNTGIEELLRRSGSSGLKKVRERTDATMPMMIESIFGYSMMQMHDHANWARKIGLGELDVNMNGVAFRTRHNDYNLVTPSKKDKSYGAVDVIEFPDVPPEVLEKASVDEQIAEMREWFKAFKERNDKERDYFKYFKPVLCYMEAAWTRQNDQTIEDGLHGNTFKQSATDFNELQMENIFDSDTGHMDFDENFAFLPTKLMMIDGKPEMVQWNYRILCHEIGYKGVDTHNLKILDDFHIRFKDNNSLLQDKLTNLARFRLSQHRSGEDDNRRYVFGLLDRLMEQIPGMDNYNSEPLLDKTYNVLVNHAVSNSPLNAANYHRWYQVLNAGAMGDFIRHKGFNDQHIFMAQTTQEKVAPWYVEYQCVKEDKGKRDCEYTSSQRWTYAIPLEIIFLTPLSKWNPYKIENKGDNSVTANDRYGGTTKETAYDGINDANYYLTPQEMFENVPRGRVKGVLAGDGSVKKVVASGIPTFTPSIPGLGKIRLRYPIVPLSDDGEISMRELMAVKDFFLNIDDYRELKEETMARQRLGIDADENLKPGHYLMAEGDDKHTHRFMISDYDIKLMEAGNTITVQTTRANGHGHSMTIQRTETGYLTVGCDGKPGPCEGHDNNNFRIDMEGL